MLKKSIFVILLSVTLFTVGCKEDLNADKLAPTMALYAPFTNDTVKYGKTVINYTASDEQGILNVNVFVNDAWQKTFQPSNGQLPEIYLTVDSAMIGKLFSYYISIVDLSNNVTISEKRTGLYVSGTLEAPEAPADPELTELTQTIFQVTWASTAPFTDGLELWRKAGTAGTYAKVKDIHVDSLSVLDTVPSVYPIPRYFYKILAKNHYGKTFSSEVSITKAPSAVGSIGLLELSTTIFNIYWEKITSKSTTGLELWRKTGSSGTYEYIKSIPVAHNNVNDTVSDPTPKYYYKIRSTNNFGGTFSDEVITTGAAIPPPYSIVLTVLPSGYVQVSWSYGNATINYFRVERGVTTSSFDVLVNLLPDKRSFVDSTVNWSAVGTYYYRVVAVRGPDVAISDVKSISKGTNPTIPVPSGVKIQPKSHTQINIEWNNTATAGMTACIERRRNGDGSFQEIAKDITLTGVSNVYEDKQVTSPNTYEYRVRYSAPFGYGNYSNSISAVLQAPGSLASPANFAATAVGRHETRLTWARGSSEATGYRVQRGLSSFQYTTIGEVSGGAVSEFNDSSASLLPNMTYVYRVQALSDIDSAATEGLSVVMLDFDAPSNIAFERVGSGIYKITWKINRQYVITTLQTAIERKWTGNGQSTFSEIARVFADTQAYVDSGLTVPSEYVYRLRAIDGTRSSEYSAEVVLQTISAKIAGRGKDRGLYASSEPNKKPAQLN